MVYLNAVYVLWLREMKRFLRAKSRILGALATPLFFLVFLGFGFSKASLPGLPGGVDYLTFIVPGIVGMNLLFGSTFAGVSVLWDREFGFLKEIMVAPVDRFSIVLGRIAGGMTTALIQATLLFIFTFFIGFKVQGIHNLAIAFVFMALISATFIGLGLIFASQMRDPQGFQLIVNFVIFPFFFLSGALYPMGSLPAAIRFISYIDPLTYGIDGMRAALIGASAFPMLLDLAVLSGFALLMVFLGAFLFERSESV